MTSQPSSRRSSESWRPSSGRACFLRKLQTEDGHHFLEIFPYFGFRVGVAQKIGGMIRGHEFAPAKVKPFAAEMGDASIGLKQCFCRDGAEANNDFGRDDVELPQKKRGAGGDFVFFGRAIFRR